MNTVLYWQGIVGYQEAFSEYIQELQDLLLGRYAALNLEKLRTSKPLYSIRTNKAGRILFTTIDNKICLLEILENHDYQKSIYLNQKHFKISHKIDLDEALDLNHLFEASQDVAGLSPVAQIKALDLKPAKYYQHQFITFTQAQDQTLQTKIPAIIHGPAGSGKTCIATEILQQFIENNLSQSPDIKVAYLTLSPKLKRFVASNWAQSHLAKDDAAHLDILCYEDLFSAAAPPLLTLSDEKHLFKTWYEHKTTKTYMAKIEGLALLTPELLFKEFRVCSIYLENPAEYDALGKRESLVDKHLRPHVLALCSRFIETIRAQGLSQTFGRLTLDTPYDFVVIDEAQDLSYQQLLNIHQLSKERQIIYFLGRHQVLYDGLSRLPFIQNLFFKESITPEEVHLSQSFRCPHAIATISQKFVDLKYTLTGGCLDKSESFVTETIIHQDNDGHIHWSTPKAAPTLLQQASQNAQTALVCSLDKKDELEPHLSPDQVFSYDEIKGLEYETIILWRPLDCAKAIDANKKLQGLSIKSHSHATIHRAKAQESDLTFLTFFDEIITACTRAKKTLIIVQEEKHANQLLISHLKDKVAPLAAADIGDEKEPNLEQSHEAVWLDRVDFYVLQQDYRRAYEIFTQRLGRTHQEFLKHYRLNESDLDGFKNPKAATLPLKAATATQSKPKAHDKENKAPLSSKPSESQIFSSSLFSALSKSSALPKRMVTAGNIEKLLEDINFTKLSMLASLTGRSIYNLSLEPCVQWEEKNGTFVQYLDVHPAQCKLFFKGILKEKEAAIHIPFELIRKSQMATLKNPELIQSIHKFYELIFLLSKLDKQIVVTTTDTFYSIALKNDKIEILNILLTMPFYDPNETNCFYQTTPICAAILQKRLHFVKKLLQIPEVDVNKPQHDGKSPLFIACEYYRSNVCLEIIALLLREPNIQVNEQEPIKKLSPLSIACMLGHVEVVKLLLTHPKIDLNVLSIEESNAFHIAAQFGEAEIIQLLKPRAHEFDVNCCIDDGSSAILMAAQAGHLKALKAMRDIDGLKWDLPNKALGTPFLVSVLCNQVKVIDYLWDIDSIDKTRTTRGKDGITHIAVMEGHVEVLNYLKTKPGIDWNLKNAALQTPAMIACSEGKLEVVQVLLEIESIQWNGNGGEDESISALHCAIHAGHDQIAALVVDKLMATKQPLAMRHLLNFSEPLDKSSAFSRPSM